MHILVAPDKFKGSLGAQEVGERIAAGLRAVLPQAEIRVMGLADGGEGTAEAISRARGGRWISCAAHDALGRVIRARYAWLDEPETALVEMSEAAGIQRLAPNERHPLTASTFGVGEMLLAAAARNAREIILGLGGSATNDGGFGMARALGFRFFANDGRELRDSITDLEILSEIERPKHFSLPRITAACDVANPLLGERGASRIFGPQKGATPEQTEMLERSLQRLAEVSMRSLGCDYRNTPGAGAAGGLGFGLLTFCGAEIRSGFDVVAEMIGLRDEVERAEVVITGEGKLDRQTLEGKVPAGVARLAREFRKPIFAIVGRVTDESEVRQLFDGIQILDDATDNFRNTPHLLETRARELAPRLREVSTTA
jgi:glycerate kinase